MTRFLNEAAPGSTITLGLYGRSYWLSSEKVLVLGPTISPFAFGGLSFVRGVRVRVLRDDEEINLPIFFPIAE